MGAGNDDKVPIGLESMDEISYGYRVVKVPTSVRSVVIILMGHTCSNVNAFINSNLWQLVTSVHQ